MKTINYLLILIIAIVSFACAGKKFDYQSAYKFKSPQPVQRIQELNHPNDELTANTEQIIKVNLNKATTIIAEEAYKEESLLESTSKRDEIISSLSKKEKRIFHKLEKKIERKMEAPPAASKSVNAKVYTGVVVGAAGLVLMILTSGTLGAIGGIALLVGLIFIVWGLLE